MNETIENMCVYCAVHINVEKLCIRRKQLT